MSKKKTGLKSDLIWIIKDLRLITKVTYYFEITGRYVMISESMRYGFIGSDLLFWVSG